MNEKFKAGGRHYPAFTRREVLIGGALSNVGLFLTAGVPFARAAESNGPSASSGNYIAAPGRSQGPSYETLEVGPGKKVSIVDRGGLIHEFALDIGQ